MKKYFFLILYYVLLKRLPVSHSLFGKPSKMLRFYCAKNLFKRCGQNVNVEKGAHFGNGREIEIGDYSGIGVNCIVPPNVKIGKYVMMGPNVIIYNSTHNYDKIDKPMIFQGNRHSKPLKIEDDVWIGTRVIILPNVSRIGTGSIIGAGSVVTKNVPDFAIVGGNPAKVLKYRSELASIN